MRKIRGALRRVRQGANQAWRAASNAAFWRTVWICRIWRRPVWFTDRFGITMRLYPIDPVQPTLERKLHFDDDRVLKASQKLLQPGMTVFDVGANYGSFALFAAGRIGPSGQLHTFEPTAYSFRRLRENVDHAKRGRTEFFFNQIAVSNQNGRAAIYCYPEFCSAWNSLAQYKMFEVAPSHSEEVVTTTLDSYTSERKIERIDLLKIDVEGFEVEVLEGCRRLIAEKRIGRVIFEISIEPLRGCNKTAESVLEAVMGMGFDVHLIEADGGLSSVRLPEFKPPFFANYVAVPR